MTPEAPPQGTRRDRVSAALGWSFLNTALGRLGTLAIGIVLARLLGPEAFGTYAIAYVALVAILSFNELGVSLAIVRWRGDPRAIAPTVTTISVVMSAVLTGGVYVAAPGFATAMGDPEAAGLVQLLGLCVLINGVVATPAALLQRGFQQRRRMIIDQVNVWVGAVASVVLALAGLGALGLVIGRLVASVASGVLFVAMSPLPYRLGFDRTQVRPLLAFGVPLAGASMVVFAAGYVDQLVVGQVLGPVALGYYVLAFNLASWPVSLFSQPLRSVAPAMFARLQGDSTKMSDALLHVIAPLAAVALPVCLAIAATAGPLVGFVYGDAWLPAAEALRWLALLGALRIFVELGYDYLVVLGRSRGLLLIQVGWFVVLLPAVWVGSESGGIGGAALAQLVVAGCLVLPAYVMLLGREGVGRLRLLRRLVVPAALSAAMGAVILAAVGARGQELRGLAASVLISVVTVALLVLLARQDVRALLTTARTVNP